MDSDNLVRMANRIGDFFEAQPDREEALAGIASHIRKFWEPRMRQQLLATLDTGQHQASEIVVHAVSRFRANLI